MNCFFVSIRLDLPLHTYGTSYSNQSFRHAAIYVCRPFSFLMSLLLSALYVLAYGYLLATLLSRPPF